MMAASTPLSLSSSICLLIKLLLLLNILLFHCAVHATGIEDVKIAIFSYDNKVYGYTGKVTLNEPLTNALLAKLTKEAARQMKEQVDADWVQCPNCMSGFWAAADQDTVYFHSSVKGLKPGQAYLKVYNGDPAYVNEAIKTAIEKCSEEKAGQQHKYNGNCAEVLVINWWATEHDPGLLQPGTEMKIVTTNSQGNPEPACGSEWGWGCKEFLDKLGIQECQVPPEAEKKRKRGIVPRAPQSGKKKKQSSGGPKRKSAGNGVGSPVLTLTLGGPQSCPMPKKTAGKTPKKTGSKIPKKTGVKTGENCPKGQKPIMNKDPNVRKGKKTPACAPQNQGPQSKKGGKNPKAQPKKKESNGKGGQTKKGDKSNQKLRPKKQRNNKKAKDNSKVVPPPKKQQQPGKRKGGNA